MDRHTNGLANVLTNALKLIPGKGIGWTCYQSSCSSVDLPRDNPVLISYASLLSKGYVCAWKKSVSSEANAGPDMTTPLTPVGQVNLTGEKMELWLFYSEPPSDLQDLLSPQLKQITRGTWQEGVPPDQSICEILFKALRNAIERSLVDKGFYPLGCWYAKPDLDSPERSCVMCNFSLFLHAHELICTSIDIKTLNDVTTLTPELLSTAMVSKSGLNVLLSPSGLSATLTGHTYTMADDSVRDIMEEWKLFYPKMVFPEYDSDLPLAVEVVLGGVRMKYPSHGVLVMGCLEEDEVCDVTKRSCIKEDSHDVLQRWTSYHQYDSTHLSKVCNCKVAQKTIQHSLGKGEKVSLSDIRLNPKRQKEDDTPGNTALDFHEQPSAAKLLKREDLFDSGSVAVNIGPLGWHRGSTSGVPKYATPLPSPCVSLPNSPSGTQQLGLGENVSLLTIKSPLQENYDPKTASVKLSVDALGWNSREQGWWTCLSLPLPVESEPGGGLEESTASRLPKQTELVHAVQQQSKDRLSGATDPVIKATSILSISGLPSPAEEATSRGTVKQVVVSDRPVSSQQATNLKKSYVSEMEIDSKHHIKDYMSMDLLNVPESLDNIFDEDDTDLHDYQASKLSGQSSVMEVKKSGSSKDILVDLHRMFPTPPSVEQTSGIEEHVPEEHIEPIDSISSKDSWDTPVSDDEQQYIPMSFAPLPDVPNKSDLSSNCYYSPSAKVSHNGPLTSVEAMSARGCEVATHPDKFLFPPLPSFVNNDDKTARTKKRPEKLGLSSITKTPVPSNPVLPTPIHSPALRTSRHNSFYHHLSSRTTTPRDSPVVVGTELMTPTPAVLNKLLPALPEAHALFFTLNLVNCYTSIDSTNGSYNYQSTSISGEDCFTFSTHGFEEDTQEYCANDSNWLALGSNGVTKSGYVQLNDSYPVDSLPEMSSGLLEAIQNLSYQMLFEDIDVLASDREGSMKTCSSSVYSEKLYVSAICQSQFLMSQQNKSHFSPYLVKQPAAIVPTNEGNIGKWLEFLDTVPNATATKHVKDLKAILEMCFFSNQSLLLKPEGPLSLRDFQQLRSSQTILSNDCAPLPVPPILVGHEQDLLSVSPLCLPVWEFMMFEPFSLKKDLVYLAMVPDQPSFMTASNCFFKEVSIAYEGCSLGRHVPFSKNDINGIIPICSDPMSSLTNFITDLKKCFRESIVPVLKDMNADPSTELMNMMSGSGVSGSSATAYPLGSHQSVCPSIVLYVVITKDIVNKELIQVLDTLDKIMNDECLPYELRKLMFLQIINPEKIEGFFEILLNGKQLKKCAFGTYSCCREYYQNHRAAQSLTCFGPANDRKERAKTYPPQKHFAPLFVLAPDTSSAQSGGQPHGLLSQEEEVLFLSYCVSSDKKWLLMSSCDKHGELLNTAAIEIHPVNNKFYRIRSSRSLVLQKIWEYCMSVISGTLLRWNIVVTRIGTPSWGELTEWHEIIQDDGLLTANKILKGQCTACQETSTYPELISVTISSMQLESTFKLLSSQDHNTSFSHAIVLPPHPLTAPHSPQEPGVEDLATIFGDGGNISDTIDDNILSELRNDTFWEFDEVEPPVGISLDAVNQPLAKGYLISPDPVGKGTLWSESSSSEISVLKTLLHWQFTEIRHKNQSTPQETLGSLFLYFDALAWLNIESSSQMRKTCLPIHIMLLTNLSKVMDLLLD